MNLNLFNCLKTERFMFFSKFIQSPGSIGSITPSSSYLVGNMLNSLPWNRINTVIELGAGTGVFTKQICEKKKPDSTLIIFEKDGQMREKLKQVYPGCYYSSDAENICRVLQELNLSEVDCIISGLPFACFPQYLRERLLYNIVASLKEEGYFIAFQYSLQMKKLFSQSFKEVKVSIVPFNIPPAFVYHCKK